MADAPRYPVLAACIAQDRAPRPDEVDRVARRILREGLGTRTGGDEATAQQLAVRAARTALLGGRATN
ncbi:MAG: hypothetical protein ACTHJR_04050 [Sphingomonas sp.]|uniref:hypothetical protein n=1 Tax=Sphingomonas sp. TaxID=28214 RepID=UPI003F7F7796